MRFRLIHNQNVDGTLIISDIDSGLPNESFGIYRKQAVYLPYHHTYFDSEGMVQVDRTLEGFIDLVPSDKVKLSHDRGVIKGLEDNGFLTVVEIAEGDLDAPAISSATFAVNDASGDDDGSVDVSGTKFLSTDPYESTITITDDSDGESVTFTTSEVIAGGGTFTETTIMVPASLHGLGDATGDVENVVVTADTKTDSSAVTEV